MIDTTTIDKRFRKLFQDGKLVQVHVSKWGMSHSLSEKDLGLDKTTEEGAKAKSDVPSFMLLGKKWLFTDDVRLTFGRIEAAARKFLSDNSHKFEIADAHFVTQKSLVKVLTTLAEYKEQYDKATAAFLENYDKHKQKMLETYPDHRPLLEPYYPSIEQIRPKFGFSVSVYEVAFPKALKKITVVDVLTQNLAVEQMKAKYEKQMEEQYKQSVAHMEAFVRESALALRSEIVSTFEVIAKKIKGKEVITGTNLKTLRNTIESFDALDFLDDAKIKENLKTVKALVTSGADFKDDAAALERLTAAVTTTLETARNITDVDSLTGGYIRRLDVGDDL